MTLKDVQKKKIPSTPGVYLFKRGRSVLYVGKATSLKSRVRSYFVKNIRNVRSPLIAQMVEEATSISFEETDSVLEALILEANLIKKYQPIYNSKEKDDKSFNYVLITKEPYPRLLSVRGKELERTLKQIPAKYLYGPFPKGSQFKEALRLIRKIFPYFDTTRPVEDVFSSAQKKKMYFNQQIGIFPGTPGELPAKTEYARTINHLKLFFEGKKKRLISELEKEMKRCAEHEEFERASAIRKQIFALTHIQDVSLIKEEFRILQDSDVFRIEAYDVAHTSGTYATGVMVVVVGGELIKKEYRKFKLTKDANNDTAGLREILLRRFAHTEWEYPRIIIVDGGKAQCNTAERVLKELGYEIPVVGVVKDEHHRARGILGDKKIISRYEKDIVRANTEAHRFAISYHRKLRGTIR